MTEIKNGSENVNGRVNYARLTLEEIATRPAAIESRARIRQNQQLPEAERAARLEVLMAKAKASMQQRRA